MPAKLKVFRYSDGFHAWTVAAPSRARALAAWGVKRDLFKDGSAEQIAEGPDYEAALNAPGELIERGLSVDIGKVERTQAAKGTRRRPTAKDRAKVDELEARLAALDADHQKEAAELDREREALGREAEALRRRHERAREALEAKLKAARAKLG